MKKIYILDTNVLMYDPKSLFVFEDNEVVIPFIVLDELDKHKSGPSQSSKHARMAVRSLDELRGKGKLAEGVVTDWGGTIRVEMNHISTDYDLDLSRADNRIISVALGCKKENPDSSVIVVSKDINLRVKCDALGVRAEDFISDVMAKNMDSLYSGVEELDIPYDQMNQIHVDGFIDYTANILYPNQYALLRSEINRNQSALARYSNGKLYKVGSRNNIWGISPRNKEQIFALDALFNDDIKLVTIAGLPGGGKTLMAVAAGVSQILDSNKYNKMVMTRPTEPMGRDLGFLPGSLSEKMDPWMVPLYDNLELIFSEKGKSYLETLYDCGKIEVQPLTYIRGRSMPKSYIILDECLTADHLVELSDGTVKQVNEVMVGDEVCCLDLNNVSSTIGRVDGVVSREANKIHKIKLKNTTLKVTPNHPFYLFRDFNFVKKQAEDVRVGEFIPSPIFAKHKHTNDLGRETAYFLGMILSDGHIEKNLHSMKIAVSKDKQHFEDRFRSGVNEICGEDLSTSFTNLRGDFVISLNRKKILLNLCEKYNLPIGKKSRIIRVPKQVFNASLETIASFISSCYDAGGDVNTNKCGSLIINYSTASYLMAKDMQFLLRKFGIVSSCIQNKENMNRVILTGFNALKFYEKIGFKMQRKQDKLVKHFETHTPLDKSRIPVANLLRDRLRKSGVKARDPLFSNIVSSKTIYRHNINKKYKSFFTESELQFINSYDFYDIKEIGVEHKPVLVYDFRVPDTGTFVVDGMISSNCQNISRHEVKTLITRVGEGSKVVLTGDIEQIDSMNLDAFSNALTCVAEIFKNEPIAAHVTMKKGERSELATLASKLL